MKRTLAALLAAVMVLGMLAGCGSSASSSAAAEDTASAASAEETAATDEAAPADEAAPGEEAASAQEGTAPEVDTSTGMTIEENEALFPLAEEKTYTIFYPFAPPLIQMGYEDPAELNYFKTLYEMTNVKLDFTIASVETLSDKFSLLVAGGDYPDIFCQCLDEYSGGATAAIEDEVMLDLADYIDEYAPHYKALMASDDSFRKNNFTDDGQQIQFMSYYDNVYVNQGYFYRTDYLEELGMDVPVTYDDWYEYLKACKSTYGTASPSRGIPSSGFYGITVDDMAVIDGQVVYTKGDEAIQSQILALAEQWYADGLYSQETQIDGALTDSDLRGMVTAGELILCTTDVDQYKVFQEEVPIKAVEYPVLNEGDTPYQVVNQNACGNGNAISTQCEDVETLVEYFDYWYSDEVILLANWGIEGETYTVNDDGSYSYTDEVLNFAGGMNLATSVYCAGWEPTRIDFTRKNVAYNDDQLEALDIWNQTDGSQNYPQFATFTPEESEIIKTTYADIQTYADEAYTKFLVGESTYENDFQAFVDQLEAMGIQEVIDVYQAAYDRYQAR